LQLIIHEAVKQKKQGLKSTCCVPINPNFLPYNTKGLNNLLLCEIVKALLRKQLVALNM